MSNSPQLMIKSGRTIDASPSAGFSLRQRDFGVALPDWQEQPPMLVLARLVGFSSRRATGDEKHDGSAISTLNVLWVLYDQVLRYDPHNPKWEGRDRFLLSKGHGPLALYAILATKGYTIWM